MTPDIECPTGQVFGALEGARADSSSAWHNDLESAALRVVPELARFRDRLLGLGGDWHLAGSGSSFFRIETQRPTPDELGDLAARAGALRYCGVHRLFGSGARVEAVHGQATGSRSSPHGRGATFTDRLYDLASDPGERDDLSAALPELAARLAQRLTAWRALADAGAANGEAGSEVSEATRNQLEDLGYF